jgi:hypothetical protein
LITAGTPGYLAFNCGDRVALVAREWSAPLVAATVSLKSVIVIPCSWLKILKPPGARDDAMMPEKQLETSGSEEVCWDYIILLS